MTIRISDTGRHPVLEDFPTLQEAMTALVARYPEAVFSDIDFEHEPTIWVWPSNAASQQADERDAVAWIREIDEEDV